AVHGFDVYEPQHSGFWRGSFAHKNVAGPVMAFLSYIGFYLYRRGWRAIGAGIFVGAIFFLLQTGSKTTAGLVPAAILAVALPGLMGLRWLTAVGFILAMIVTAVGTLGVEFIPPFKAYITENMPDFTYTGRTQLWRFVSELIAQRPWTGFGFESVWGSPTVRDTYPAFDQTWDVRGIVNAHNGYLDIAVTMGLPALALACIAMMIVPAIDYLRVPKRRENIYLSDLFMMMIFFGAQNAFLESFFFKRAEPVWLLFFLAAFGMRYAARFPLKSPGEK
ncbi:O-antigen ligase family protein, partial [Salmonella enterica subsp. enterica serovar Java]|nr:O-antigen ligase family protein [Salmonella enterica subsp. enterica serovar Java]